MSQKGTLAAQRRTNFELEIEDRGHLADNEEVLNEKERGGTGRREDLYVRWWVIVELQLQGTLSEVEPDESESGAGNIEPVRICKTDLLPPSPCYAKLLVFSAKLNDFITAHYRLSQLGKYHTTLCPQLVPC